MDYATLEKICEQGTLYNPAGKHYGDIASRVKCDRCYRENIDACYGLENYDVCISCYNDVKSKKQSLKRSLQEGKNNLSDNFPDDFNELPMSRMEVGQFNPNVKKTQSSKVAKTQPSNTKMPMSRMKVTQFDSE